MVERYFECYKCGECCDSVNSKPSVSLGDYYRIAEKTLLGKLVPMKIAMAFTWMVNGDFSCTFRGYGVDLDLGLLHDPCPYLNSKKECHIYSFRPNACIGFPELDYCVKEDVEMANIAKHFKCLQGVRYFSKKLKLVEKIYNVMYEEKLIDSKYFWNGKEFFITAEIQKAELGLIMNDSENFEDIGGYIEILEPFIEKCEKIKKEKGEFWKRDGLIVFSARPKDQAELFKKAIAMQTKRDPRLIYLRTGRLLESIESLTKEFQKVYEIHSKGTRAKVDTNKSAFLMGRVMYAIYREEIANRILNLDDDAIEAMKETTRKREEIIKRFL